MTTKIYELRKHHTEFFDSELKTYNHYYNLDRFNKAITLYNMTADSAFDLVLDDRLNGSNLEYGVLGRFSDIEDALKALDEHTAEVSYMNRRIYIEHYSVAAIGIDEDGDEVEWYGEEWNCENFTNPYADSVEDEEEE